MPFEGEVLIFIPIKCVLCVLQIEGDINRLYFRYCVKVAFSQKGLRRLSFLQTDEPNYFPELQF